MKFGLILAHLKLFGGKWGRARKKIGGANQQLKDKKILGQNYWQKKFMLWNNFLPLWFPWKTNITEFDNIEEFI